MKPQLELSLPNFSYRFSVTNNLNNSILGTGCFKVSKEMTKEEQIDFMHQYTNGRFLNKEAFVSIEIFNVTNK